MNQTCENCRPIKNKRIYILISIILVVAIAIAAVCLVSCSSNYELGVVTQISIKQKNADTMELRIKYRFASGGYSVRVVPEDEGEYCGDGMRNYDGALGKYRIMIDFGDVELSDSFAKKMDENRVIKITEDVRARVASPSDHGFVLYIGSDEPISIEPVENGKLNSFGGTIRIPITVGDQ